jgi:maltose-binding protein MalE
MGKISQFMQLFSSRKQIFSLFILIPIVVTLVAGYGISSSRTTDEHLPEVNPVQATPSPTSLSVVKQKASVTQEVFATPIPSGTIILWHSWTGKELDGLNQVISDFQERYSNISVEMKYIPHDDLPARLESEIEEGRPDLLLGLSSWGPRLYDAGLVADVTGTAKPNFFEKIGSAALDTVRYKNVLIGLPISYNRGMIIYRNRSIFPEAPKTLDGYLEAATNITRGDIIGGVIDLGFYQSGAFLSACRGSLMDVRGYPLFDNASGLCWMELLRKFQVTGLPLIFNTDVDLERFKTGRTGFIIAGTWDTANLAEAIDPENLAIDPWPVTDKGDLSGFMETDVIYLSTNIAPENQAASRILARYFLQAKTQGDLANLSTAAKIPTLKGIELQDQLMQEALIALESGTPLPGMSAMIYYQEPMDNAIRSVLVNGEDPNQALEKAAIKIQIKVKELQSGS